MPESENARSWKVLLIGGNSGAGKTTIARELSRHFGVPWLQVDDLRLLLEHNLDETQNPHLHHFDDLSRVYQNPPETLARWRIETAQETSRSIEVVIANHASYGGPAIIEGDDIVPALAAQRSYAGLDVDEHDVSAVFLVEDDEAVIEANMCARGRDFLTRPANEWQNQVRMSRLYGEWLAREALQHRVPAVEPRPYETLVERVLTALP